MLMFKKKYYLFVENTRDLNLDLIKKRDKFNIIYRNLINKEKIRILKTFRDKCKRNGINFYIANDTNLLSKVRADGLYISANNKNLLLNAYTKKGFKVIGAAHNQREIDIKVKQGCGLIIYSRLFETTNPNKKGHLGIQKFNIISLRSKIKVIPLGGININNLSKLNNVKSESFACLSAVKKKPTNIISRLF